MAEDVHPGALIFGALVCVMLVVSALGAMPPARDYRVFFGASAFAAAWLIVSFAVKDAGTRAITSSMVGLDVFYAVIFYLLSKPSRKDPSCSPQWAAYIVAIFVAIIALEFGNLLFRHPSIYALAAAACMLGVAGFIGWGFARGFGARAAGIFLACCAATAMAAVVAYHQTVNFLTLIVILIIIAAGFRPARRNLKAWFGRSMDPAQRDDSFQRVAPHPAQSTRSKTRAPSRSAG